MRFSLSADQAALRDSVAGFVDKYASTSATREVSEGDSAFDRALWDRSADQVGVQGLLLPGQWGGAGAGVVDTVVAIEQFGRTLACPTLLVSTVAAQAILFSGDESAADKWLPPLAAGHLIATFALAGPCTVGARRRGENFALDGIERNVSDVAISDVVVIRAELDGQEELFVVSLDADGIRRELRPCLDTTRRVGDISFANCPAARLECADPSVAIARTLDRAMILLAAEQLGGAQACLDAAGRYAKERVAFGQPIGAFQAIKHRCATMYLEVEAARCAVLHAAGTLDSQAAAGRREAALTQTYCSDMYISVAQSNMQVHGGIGFTWEHDAHLFLKRARVDAHLFGLKPIREEIALNALRL